MLVSSDQPLDLSKPCRQAAEPSHKVSMSPKYSAAVPPQSHMVPGGDRSIMMANSSAGTICHDSRLVRYFQPSVWYQYFW